MHTWLTVPFRDYNNEATREKKQESFANLEDKIKISQVTG